MNTAIKGFSALGHDTRLRILRLLVSRMPDRVPAGEIGARLGVVPSTLSAHLTVLDHAGLVSAERRERNVLYAAEIDGIQALVKYLLADCCQGNPEVCGDMLETVLGSGTAGLKTGTDHV